MSRRDNYIIVDGKMIKVDIYVIYAIKSGNLIKVGVTTNLGQRFNTINQYRMDAELIYNTDKILNGYEVEAKIHNKLNSIHYNGEWYYGNKEEFIIDTIKSVVDECGKYVSNYVLATEKQIEEYISKGHEEFKRYMDDNMAKSAYYKIESLKESIEKYLEKYTGLSTIVKCYNGIIYVDPQIIHDAYNSIDVYYEGWIVDYIYKHGYIYGSDYIIDGGIYISIGVAKELCSLINDNTLELRIILSYLEKFILENYFNLGIWCGESKLTTPKCDDVDAYLELALVDMNISFVNHRLTLDEYLQILGMELENTERNNVLVKLEKMAEIYKAKNNIKQNENGIDLYPIWLLQNVFDKLF